ncbi:disease resistance protein RGA2 [Trifolium repens]|nr:disease resistance protein RGA2 [Trifolium repens]
MAEQILCSVAESLVNRLASAAFREFGRINSVEDELKRLENTVDSIRDALFRAEEKQEQNWIKKLKDVLIPAEDLLDEFHIQYMIHKRDEPHRNKVTKVLHFFSPKKFALRRNTARGIEKIQNMFADMVRDMSALNLNSKVVVVGETNNEWRETSSYVLGSDIIGRDDDKEKIVNLLRRPHGDRNVSFIAIVGMGGLGKTALAQFIYNDKEVKDLFEKRMWVCVSDNFEVKTIVKKMLKSLKPNETIDDTLSLDNLQTMLRGELIGKRYLLVLDDVWDHNFLRWAELETYLKCGAHGSKVVVTTRSTSVAQTMRVHDSYVLNGLTSEKSWSLLKKIAFGDDANQVDPNIESIGKMIAKKCKGIPLTIRSLGGILHCKTEEKEYWNNVLQGDFWNMCEGEENILPVLKLSYNNLLPQQRQCFAYCSLFPKDWEFDRVELIQMWMAHGYLDSPVKGKCMEDLGNQFVNIFLTKSFFHEAEWNDDGDILGFKMHDLMHDLAKRVAGDDCCYLDNNAKGYQGRAVHVSVEFDALDLLKSLNPSRLRTLIVFSSDAFIASDASNVMDGEKESLISTFKYLRVLKFCDIGQHVSIEKLNHLRFLKSSLECKLKSFHKSIGNLICLQTLEMRLDEKAILTTKVISKLINLRHLCIGQWTFKDKTPVGFGKLSIQQQKGVMFSKWLSPLTNIIEITLSSCQGFKYLPPLERLPFLESLMLCYLNDLEYIYYEEFILHEPFFQSLKRLEISLCRKLVGWKRMGDDFNDIITSSQFPCLSFLSIIDCSMLIHMPTFPNIKSLSLEDCSEDILEATLNTTMGCTPLSILKTLQIIDTRKTTRVLTNVPQHWLQNLTSLENLEFQFLSNQQFQAIEIWFKEDFNYLPSLRNIEFSHCSLKALPDWICNISSLQHINIYHCDQIALLPDGMSRLTNLHTLEIIGCSLLIKEFQKIAHIPNIIIKDGWGHFLTEKIDGVIRRKVFSNIFGLYSLVFSILMVRLVLRKERGRKENHGYQ